MDSQQRSVSGTKPGRQWTAVLSRVLHALRDPAVIYFLATGLSGAAGFVLVPLYARKLTPAQYGDYAFAQLIVAALPVLLTGGLLSAVSRFYFDGTDLSEAKRRVGGVARWLILLSLVWATALEAIILTLAPRGEPTIANAWELSCLLWASVGAIIGGIPATYLRAARRPLPAAAFQIGHFCSAVLANLILVGYLDRGLRGALEAMATTSVLDGCVGTSFVLLALRGPMTRRILGEGLRFGLPLVPHSIAVQLQQTAERWVLKAAGLTSALGGYGLAYQLLSPATMAVSAWNDSKSPDMGEAYRSGSAFRLKQVFPRIARSYLIVCAVPVTLILAALPLVRWVLGETFAALLWQLPFIAGCVLIESLYYPSVNALFYLNRTRTIPALTLTFGLVNLALAVILVPWLGIAGAILGRAISSLGRTVAVGLAANVAMRRDSQRLASQAAPGGRSV